LICSTDIQQKTELSGHGATLLHATMIRAILCLHEETARHPILVEFADYQFNDLGFAEDQEARADGIKMLRRLHPTNATSLLERVGILEAGGKVLVTLNFYNLPVRSLL
jgi:hypothetical protein